MMWLKLWACSGKWVPSGRFHGEHGHQLQPGMLPRVDSRVLAPARAMHGAAGHLLPHLVHALSMSYPGAFCLPIPRSRVPELAAAHMQQEQGGQVRPDPVGGLCCEAVELLCLFWLTDTYLGSTTPPMMRQPRRSSQPSYRVC